MVRPAVVVGLVGLGALLLWSLREEPLPKEAADSRAPEERSVPAASGLPDGARSGRVPLARPSALVLEGVCSDRSGRPIVPAPRILLADERGRRFLRPTDAQGSYRIQGLEPGAVRIECSATGFSPEVQELRLSEGQAPGPVNFALERMRTVQVRLLTPEGGSFLEEARRLGLGGSRLPEVVAHVRDGSGAESSIPVSLRASWSFALPEKASAEVTARLGEVELDSRRVAPGATRVELVVSCADVRAHLASLDLRVVRAEDRAALEDATAWLELEHARVDALAGPDGRLGFAECPPGPARLWIVAAGRERLGLEVLLEAGTSRALGEIALGAALCASGRSTDAEGRPRSAALTIVRRDRSGAVPRRVSSGPDGRFQIGELAAGRWRLAPVGQEKALEFELGRASRTDLVVVVSP